MRRQRNEALLARARREVSELTDGRVEVTDVMDGTNDGTRFVAVMVRQGDGAEGAEYCKAKWFVPADDILTYAVASIVGRA